MADEVVIDTLRIEVTGDTGKATEGIDKLITTLEKIKGATSGGNKGFDAIQKSLDKINESISHVDSSAFYKLKQLADGIKGLSDVGKIKFGHTAEGIMALGYAVDSLKDVDFSKLAEMSSGVQTLSTVGSFNLPQMKMGASSADPTVAQSFEGTIEAVSQTEKRTRDELAKTTSHFSKFGAEIRKAIKDPQKAIKEFQNSATKALLKVQSAASKLSKAVKLYFSAMALPFRPLTKRLSDFGSRLSNLFTMIKKRTMYRAINAALSAITKGLKEGTDNAYQYSKAINGPFASSMDRIATTLLYFRNSIGAAVMPLVNMLAPAIDLIVDKAVELINTFNQLFARLSGASTWTKAIRYPKEYAEAANDAKKANEDLKKTILGFDQLNVLNDNSSKNSSKSKSGEDYSKMFEEVALVGAMKNPFIDFFKPFQDAWTNEGQNTINAIKTAFKQVKDALAAVGESFRTVWLNGTGQQSVETILRIVQNIVGTVGNLAESFKNAWKENEVGTGIVQGIWNIFNSILGTIERITESTKIWASQLNLSPLLQSVHNFLEKIKPLIDNIGKALEWVWDNIILPFAEWAVEDVVPAGIDLISAAISLLNTVVDKSKPLLEWLWDKFLKPLGEWVGDKVVDALKSITDLLNDLNDLLSGKTSFKEFIDQLSFGQAVLLGVAAAVGVAVAAFVAFQAVSAIVAGVGAAISFLTSPIGLVIAAIGALIAIGALLVTHWDEIKAVAVKVWTSIKDFFVDLADKITDFVMKVIEGLFDFMKSVWEGTVMVAKAVWGGFKDFWLGLWEIISTAAKTVWNALKTFFTSLWSGIKTTATNIWNGIRNFFTNTWNSIKNTATNVWNGIKNGILNVVSGLKNGITTAFDFVRDRITSIMERIRTTMTNVWEGIKNAVRTPINAILGFIERFVNGVINAFNNMINALNRLSFDVPSWVPGIGGSKFGFNIQTLHTVSIPRLENGGMVNAGTMFIAGEAGAEVVAQMGSRTGVMNTDEMQQSVERGILNATGSIANAVAAAIIRANQNGGAPTVEVTVTADSETLYKTVRKGEKYYNNRYHVVAGV